MSVIVGRHVTVHKRLSVFNLIICIILTTPKKAPSSGKTRYHFNGLSGKGHFPNGIPKRFHQFPLPEFVCTLQSGVCKGEGGYCQLKRNASIGGYRGICPGTPCPDKV